MGNLDYIVFLVYFLIVASYGYWIYQRKKKAEASATDFFLAEGSMKCQEVIQHPNARFISGLVPDAIPLGQLGYKKWIQSSFEDVESFEPFYLKDFLIRKPNLA